MISNLIIPNELFTAFNNVQYYDEPHKYLYDGKQLISVTTLIDKFAEPFEEDYWSARKGSQFKVPQNQILDVWKYINRVGIHRGSTVHDYAEHIFNNKVFPYPKQRIYKIFGCDPIWETYLKSKAHVDKFYADTYNKLIPIKVEYVVFDKEYQIGGMVDLLFYNVRAKEFQIWDWKTNKDFDYEGKSNFSGPLGFLKNSDIEHYSIQLATYKHIIEKNTGIKLGKSYLIWVSHKEDNYEVIECKNRDIYVEKMITAYNRAA